MKLTNKNAGFLTALIKELEETYPNVLPLDKKMSIESLRVLQGQQDILQHLRNLLDKQDRPYED